MKTFTDPQKKWALATALLFVLGSSASFNKHGQAFAASADFASEAAPANDEYTDSIATEQGVVPVKVIKGGDNQIIVVTPKITESGFCMTGACGSDTLNLSVAFGTTKAEMASINVAILKEAAAKRKSNGSPNTPPPIAKNLDATRDDDTAPIDVNGKHDGDTDSTSREDRAKQRLDKMARDCKRDSHRDPVSMAPCLTNGLAHLMDIYQDTTGESTPGAFSKIFTNFVLNVVNKQINNALAKSQNDIAVAKQKSRSAQNNMDVQNAIAEKDAAEDAQGSVLTEVQKLIQSILPNYEQVRRAVVVGQAVQIHDVATQVQNLRQQAKSGDGTAALEAADTLQYLGGLQQQFRDKDTAAFNSAESANILTYDQANKYQTLFSKYTGPIVSGLVMDQNYQVPPFNGGNSSADTTVTTGTANGDYNSRTTPGGRTSPGFNPNTANNNVVNPINVGNRGNIPGQGPNVVNPINQNMPNRGTNAGIMPLPGTAGAPTMTANGTTRSQIMPIPGQNGMPNNNQFNQVPGQFNQVGQQQQQQPTIAF